ncbi:hypothetical protein OAF54_00965 [bacterium]|nr:hypothetical protein [bacterium]
MSMIEKAARSIHPDFDHMPKDKAERQKLRLGSVMTQAEALDDAVIIAKEIFTYVEQAEHDEKSVTKMMIDEISKYN